MSEDETFDKIKEIATLFSDAIHHLAASIELLAQSNANEFEEEPDGGQTPESLDNA